MKSSRVLLVSIFITAVILVMIGGITTIVLANKNTNAGQAVSPEALQAYQQREIQYKQLIQQANQQIEKANTDLQTIQNQMAQAQQPQTTSENQAAAAAPAPAISADKAGEIASQAAEIGQTPTKKADRVSFEGKAAYEVVFDKGSIYVDSQTGEVLFNGTVPQKITANKAAQIAGDYLNNHDILQVDQITFRNAPLFRVIFKNGTMAYLDITGQITYVQAKEPKTIIETHNASQPAALSSAPTTSTGGFSEHEGSGGADN